MLTNCEVNFYTRTPNLLSDLVKAVESLTKEVKELKEQLKKAEE